MIKEKEIQILINSCNIKHFKDKILSKIDNNTYLILIKIEDLKENSHIKITAICDICSKEKEIEYRTYLHNIKKTGFYRCQHCRSKAMPEIFKEKYGVTNPFQLEEVKEKSKQTNMQKYGYSYYNQTQEYKEKYLLGEKNNFYIDGRNLNTDCRNNSKLKTWRREVYERDNYKCCLCGNNDIIEAHHIKNYSSFPEERYEINNGITLCKKHHRKFHNIYGYINNTEIQFKDFLESQTTISDECKRVLLELITNGKCVATFMVEDIV